MAIHRLVLVLALLATTGNLVHARHSFGMYYGENEGYRGVRDNDYSTQAYGSTERYYRSGDYDFTAQANSERYYKGGDYDYTANSERYYKSGGDDYAASFDQMKPSYFDWDVAERSYLRSEGDHDDHHDDHDAPAPSDSGHEDDHDAPAPSGSGDDSPPAGASGNPIDDCWRHDPNWANNRQALASCAIGFGKNAIGGAEGPIYVVTDETDEDLVNPKEGTLRYAVLQDDPLWIGFARNMTIQLTNELIMTSHKTIDGRGFDIHISGGAGLTIQYVGHVIVHGVHIHDLHPTPPAVIRSNSTHAGHRNGSDGDAINIFGSHDVWVDHCYFARGSDGLVDAIMGSTFVSVTNNFFEQHDKVMLFGAHPFDSMDNDMQISVAFNHFAPGLIERVPRLRHGHAHIFNNYYASWGEYAIGGSEGPTILSEGNVFNAPDTRDKQVTKRIDDGDASFSNNMDWNWQSVGDKFLNGAYFVSGGASAESAIYSKASSTNKIVPAEIVPDVTRDAGPLVCPPSGGLC